MGFAMRFPYRYQSRSRRSALSCPSSDLGGRDFRRAAYTTTQIIRKRTDPARTSILGTFDPGASRTHMLWKHLVERFRQVVGRLFHGIANPASVKLPAPMPGDPSAVGSAVHRPEYRTVLSDVDGPQPSLIIQTATAFCIANTFWHRSQKCRWSSTSSRLAADETPRA